MICCTFGDHLVECYKFYVLSPSRGGRVHEGMSLVVLLVPEEVALSPTRVSQAAPASIRRILCFDCFTVADVARRRYHSRKNYPLKN